jgi:serine/threonine protein kinase
LQKKALKVQEGKAVKLKQTCILCNQPMRDLPESNAASWLWKPASCKCSKAAPAQPAREDEIQTNQTQPLSAPDFGDQYEVLDTVGQGGMGEIFKVRDKNTGETLAVKVLPKEVYNEPEARRRFESEAAVVSKLAHPNIVTVYGSGETKDGRPYLIMSLLPGENLSSYLKKHGRLSSQNAIDVFIEIAEALCYAHDAGVIHRDLKPSNVMVTDLNPDHETPPSAKLVDFGIAKVMNSATARDTQDLTKTGAIFGSPIYMSPEQCLGFRLDQRSDLYSFGCLMYEAITGAPSVVADNPVRAVVCQLNDKPVSWTKTADRKPLQGLEAIVFKCLEKDKEDRYQSAQELLKDLKLFKAGKQPAKFERATKQKAVLSAWQALAVTSGLFIIWIYGQMINLTAVLSLLTAVTSPGAIIVLVMHLRKYGLQGSDWNRWMLLSKISLTALGLSGLIVCLGMASGLGMMPGFDIDKLPMFLLYAYCGVFLIHILMCTAILAFLLGPLIFQDNKASSWSKIGKQAAIILIPLLILAAADDPPFHHSFAGTLTSQNNISEVKSARLASALSHTASALGSKSFETTKMLVNSMLKEGKGKEALALINAKISGLEASKPGPFRLPSVLDNSTQNLFSLRSRIYDSLGNSKAALTDIDKAIEANPTSWKVSELWEQKGDIYLKQGDTKSAIAAYTESLDRSGFLSHAQTQLARAYVRSGDWKQAIAAYTARLGSSTHYENYLERAIVYERNGMRDLAAKDFHSTLEQLDPNKMNENTIYSPSWNFIRTVFRSSPDDGAGKSNLARSYAYSKLGEKDLAASELAKAKSFGGQKRDLLPEFTEQTGINLDF